MIGFNNGSYSPVKDITIRADSLAVNRGFGAYDFFSVINGKPFYLNRHLNRFIRTLELLKFENEHLNHLERIVHNIIELNDLTKPYGIKLFALPTEENNPPLNCDLYFFPTPLIEFTENDYLKGCSLILREYKRFIPEAKSTNYLASQYYKTEMDKINAVDVLYHDKDFVRETSRGNLFLVKNNVIYTAKNEVLKGISQSVLFDIMNKESISFKIKDLSVERLKDADEVFVSSSTKLVLPIVNIDEEKIGNGTPGKLSKQLLKLFLKHKEEYCK